MFAFIEASSGMSQLFNCNQPKYHLQDKKLKITWENKNHASFKKDIDITVKQTRNKRLSLRSYFSAERWKEEAAAKKEWIWSTWPVYI